MLGASADTMTPGQLHRVLEREYGRGWRENFSWFDEKPIASASIGQVHRAQARDGRPLAIKVQFPGVAESIRGDVDNLATLVRLSGLVPAQFDLEPLLEEVRRQLLNETDYIKEARSLDRYRDFVRDDARVKLPAPHLDLTTDRVLAMDFLSASPISTLWEERHSREVRDEIGALAQSLVLREIFEFRLMQSDPNFANFQMDLATGALILLDFGSMVEISEELSSRYRRLIAAAVENSRASVQNLIGEFGWVGPEDEPEHVEGLAEFILLATEPLRSEARYDYGTSDLVERVRAVGMNLTFEEGMRRPPPPDLVFINRKLAGTYLLCAQLGARVDTAAIVRKALEI